jgi:hypothetical protein
MNLPEKTYTEKDLTRVKTTSRVVGWLQGGLVVLAGALLWNFVRWIPIALGVVVVGWVLLKLFSRPKKEEEEEEESPSD